MKYDFVFSQNYFYICKRCIKFRKFFLMKKKCGLSKVIYYHLSLHYFYVLATVL